MQKYATKHLREPTNQNKYKYPNKKLRSAFKDRRKNIFYLMDLLKNLHEIPSDGNRKFRRTEFVLIRPSATSYP